MKNKKVEISAINAVLTCNNCQNHVIATISIKGNNCETAFQCENCDKIINFGAEEIIKSLIDDIKTLYSKIKSFENRTIANINKNLKNNLQS